MRGLGYCCGVSGEEEEEMTEGKKGKVSTAWFPSAKIVKGIEYAPTDRVSIALFYQYVSPLWSEARKQACLNFVEEYCGRNKIGGRVRVGQEGVNATVSGLADDLRGFASALGEFDDHFKKTEFKYIDNLTLDRAFNELKVFPVNEIVFYGISPGEDLGPGGDHLEPNEYHQKLGQSNTVVIDVRNNYEAEIGRFQKQEGVGGAEIIVPGMRKSTDFPGWLRSETTKEKLAGKEVLMYCTGGVRCERASALLKREFGSSVKGVYQLQGGIEKYMQTFPDGGYWQGKNFVFDKREAVGKYNVNGVGGVLTNNKKRKRDMDSSDMVSVRDTEEVLGHCCFCEAKWDRYIGKKKCRMCGVPILLCQNCCTKRVDKIRSPENDLKLRCPLCVEQNVTIPAVDVEFTDNGVIAKPKGVHSVDDEGALKIASKTVCKWGGGHAKMKKRNRRNSRTKKHLQSIPCRNGKECTKTDCWFSHE